MCDFWRCLKRKTAVMPRKAGHPVFRSVKRIHYRHGILGRPVRPGDDSEIYAENYSAACNTRPGFFGAIQNAAGRSNRKFAPTLGAARHSASAPTTPTTVTISEIVPMSWINPARSSRARGAAIGGEHPEGGRV